MLYNLQGNRLFSPCREALTEHTNMKTLPSTLNEIRELAQTVFSNPAAKSVNINTTFGIVTVYRDGQIFQANFQG